MIKLPKQREITTRDNRQDRSELERKLVNPATYSDCGGCFERGTHIR